MMLLLISFIPLLILLIWGKQLNENIKTLLKFLSLPFFILVAFYSLLIALGIILAFAIYFKFILPRIMRNMDKNDDDFPPIQWKR